MIWPWIVMAGVGGFDHAAWQAIGQSKLVWFVAVLLVPPAVIVYWLLVRPQLRRPRRSSPQGDRPQAGSARV